MSIQNQDALSEVLQKTLVEKNLIVFLASFADRSFRSRQIQKRAANNTRKSEINFEDLNGIEDFHSFELSFA